MNPAAMTVILLGLSGTFAWSAICRLRLIAPEQTISAHRTAGVARISIVAGAVVLLLNSSVLLCRVYEPGFDFWGLLALDTPLGGAFNAIKDVLATAVVTSAGMVVYRRLIDRRRLTPSVEGLVIVGIVSMMLADMLYDGARIAFESRLVGEEPLRWRMIEPVGSAWALWLDTLHWGDAALFRLLDIAAFAYLSSALIVLNLVPYSKYFSMLEVALDAAARLMHRHLDEPVALDAAARQIVD